MTIDQDVSIRKGTINIFVDWFLDVTDKLGANKTVFVFA
jgi:hypothetical protein